MLQILEKDLVTVTFITTQQEIATTDPELKVNVKNKPKTCRGFRSVKDKQLHILCNLERFESLSQSKKYRQARKYRIVHHEYAGLVGIEKNNGAHSDYYYSKQITGKLKEEKVLRLPIKIDYNSWQEKFYPTHTIIEKVKICGIKFEPVTTNTIMPLGTVYYTFDLESNSRNCYDNAKEVSLYRDNRDGERDKGYDIYDDDFSEITLEIAKRSYEGKTVNLILSNFNSYYSSDDGDQLLGLTNIKVVE